MSITFSEESFEKALIELFQDKLGYDYKCGYDIERDYTNPILEDILFDALLNINKLPKVAIEEAVKKIKAIRGKNLLLNNIQFMNYLQNGISVKFVENGKTKTDIVNLIDYSDGGLNKNVFNIINQYTIVQNDITKRPDLIVFINGLPLVVIELKSCSREATDSSHAYRQIKNYQQDISNLFIYNCFNVISDMTSTKIGSITASEDRYMEWKSKTGDYEETKFSTFSTLFEGVFEKSRFLEIIDLLFKDHLSAAGEIFRSAAGGAGKRFKSVACFAGS